MCPFTSFIGICTFDTSRIAASHQSRKKVPTVPASRAKNTSAVREKCKPSRLSSLICSTSFPLNKGRPSSASRFGCFVTSGGGLLFNRHYGYFCTGTDKLGPGRTGTPACRAASTQPPARNIFFAGLRCMFENQIGGPHLCLCRRSSSRLNRNMREPMRLTIFWGIWPVAIRIRPRTDEDVRPMYFAASGIGIGALSEWLPGTQLSSLREYGRLQWLR